LAPARSALPHRLLAAGIARGELPAVAPPALRRRGSAAVGRLSPCAVARRQTPPRAHGRTARVGSGFVPPARRIRSSRVRTRARTVRRELADVRPRAVRNDRPRPAFRREPRHVLPAAPAARRSARGGPALSRRSPFGSAAHGGLCIDRRAERDAP